MIEEYELLYLNRKSWMQAITSRRRRWLTLALVITFFTMVGDATADVENKYASSHIAGDFDNPDNALGVADGVWAGALNSNDSDTSRWAMENPTGALTGTQTVTVLARKGSNSGVPTVALNLYENGSLVQSIVGATNVTSTTGQDIGGTFDASAITNANDVEIEVVMVAVGGNPSVRNSAEIDEIDWTVSYSPATTSYTQNHYRWYVDSDNENVTDPWSQVAGVDLAEDTVLTPVPASNDAPSASQELRLRVNLTVNSATITGGSKYFKLQYRAGTDSSCSSGSWTDVDPGNAWEYASSSVADDTALTEAKLSMTDRLETYSKSKPANTPVGTSAVGEDIEFDYHIIGTNMTTAERYLFRVVETTSDGSGTTVLNTYSSCPVLHTEPGVNNLLRHGNFFSGQTEQGFVWAN